MWGESNSYLDYAKLVQWLMKTKIAKKAAVRSIPLFCLYREQKFRELPGSFYVKIY